MARAGIGSQPAGGAESAGGRGLPRAARRRLEALRARGARAELARAASDLAARHPAAGAPLRMLGELALEAGDTGQAIAQFRQACARDPSDGPARERLARLLVSARRLEEAVCEFRALAAECPGYPTAQTLVLEGAALLRVGQSGAAQARALEAMALAPDAPDAARLFAMTLAGAPAPAAAPPQGATPATFRRALARVLAEPRADARAAQRIAGRLLAADLGVALRDAGGLPALAPDTAALLEALLAHRLCTNLDLERELIALRSRLLADMVAGAGAPRALPPDGAGAASGEDAGAVPRTDGRRASGDVVQSGETVGKGEEVRASGAGWKSEVRESGDGVQSGETLGKGEEVSESGDGLRGNGNGFRLGALAEAFARHAFACEYLWPETPEDAARLDRLQANVEQDLAEGGGIDDRLFLLAAFRDIARIPAVRDRILRSREALRGPCRDTLRLLVLDRIEEARLAGALPTLTPVTDAVSTRVRDQYEANPYPRWRHCPEPVPEPPAAHVARSVAPNLPDLSALPAVPRILVAGCGTGRQALLWARRCPGADILAVDLSRASLAYARRALAARGIDTVRLAQADLLALDASAGQFDIVAAVGVLHHLRDPQAGLAALRARLAPGGAMHLGLYSRQARRAVAAARAAASRQGGGDDLDGLRRFRAACSAGAVPGARALVAFDDFFTASELRDLVFHVQEHCFDLGEVAVLLERARLAFLGFGDLSADTRAAYAAARPDDRWQVDLGGWSRFEAAHPDTFAGMYQMWCQAA